MPLEISEVFAMAPLYGGYHPSEYRIPNGFDMGTGNIRRMQEQLVSLFEKLANQTNSYLDAEGRAAHYGIIAFKATMDSTRASIRTIRNATVDLMTAIYKLDQTPLPPDESVDEDVSRILGDRLMSAASLPASMDEAGTSAAAEARFLGKTSKSSDAVASPLPLPVTSFMRTCTADRLQWKTSVMSDSSARGGQLAYAMGRKAPVRTKSTDIIKSVSSCEVVRGKSSRILTRGAAARFRAEAAWNARFRAAALARAQIAEGHNSGDVNC